MPKVSVQDLFSAGAHFGHQTHRWNPKMQPYLYGARGGVHIIDLTKTTELLAKAEAFAEKVTTNGRSILFVGTKKSARSILKREAESAGQPHMVERWLGGTLTNFRTIRLQMDRLKSLQEQIEAKAGSKKVLVHATHEAEKLERIFGGIKDMDVLPGALFVVDVPKEEIAVREAVKLGIPVIAMVDSNANPLLVDYPIPANDDAIKSIKLITAVLAGAASRGQQAYEAASVNEQGESNPQEAAAVEEVV